MIITVQPSDIIKRCLWNEYKKYCISNMTNEEIEKFIIEDSPMSLSEDDAYVIGLLKIVETDNLIHRFNIHIENLLKVKSNLLDNKLYINKNIISNEVKTFKNRFPNSFKPNFEYKKAIDELMIYVDNIIDEIDKIQIYQKTINEKNYTFVLSNDIKNLINS